MTDLADIQAEAMELLEKELRKSAREPFKRALTRLLGFRPTAEALQKWADKSPDRWAQAIGIMANLAGYEKGINITVTAKPVAELSDSQLLEEYLKSEAALKARALARNAARAQGASGEVVDAEVLPPLPEKVGGGVNEDANGK